MVNERNHTPLIIKPIICLHNPLSFNMVRITIWKGVVRDSKSILLRVLGFLIFWWNTVAKINEGGHDLFRLSPCSPSCREFRAGTWRQEVIQRPWRSDAYRFVPHGLLSLLLIAPRTTNPGMEPPIMDWSCTWNSNKENIIQTFL